MAEGSADLHLSVGDAVDFSKTVGESDVYLFAGITGDFAPNHINEQFMQGTGYGRRIAHGALLVGFMSACSTLMTGLARARGATNLPVSLGYDRIRFLKPVYFGDTVSCRYTLTALEPQRLRALADIQIKNQHGELVAVATHVLKWVS
jgi:3-hydroxybutyryl-CoA dehydratase